METSNVIFFSFLASPGIRFESRDYTIRRFSFLEWLWNPNLKATLDHILPPCPGFLRTLISRYIVGHEIAPLFRHAAFRTSAGLCLAESGCFNAYLVVFYPQQRIFFFRYVSNVPFPNGGLHLVFGVLQWSRLVEIGQNSQVTKWDREQPPIERLLFSCGQLYSSAQTTAAREIEARSLWGAWERRGHQTAVAKSQK